MDRSESTTPTPAAAESARRVYAVVPAFAAMFLGAFLLWGVGFAGPSVVHNAAHDTRHSAGFPCH
jgi:cobalt transporter subunit CbtB